MKVGFFFVVLIQKRIRNKFFSWTECWRSSDWSVKKKEVNFWDYSLIIEGKSAVNLIAHILHPYYFFVVCLFIMSLLIWQVDRGCPPCTEVISSEAIIFKLNVVRLYIHVVCQFRCWKKEMSITHRNFDLVSTFYIIYLCVCVCEAHDHRSLQFHIVTFHFTEKNLSMGTYTQFIITTLQ